MKEIEPLIQRATKYLKSAEMLSKRKTMNHRSQLERLGAKLIAVW